MLQLRPGTANQIGDFQKLKKIKLFIWCAYHHANCKYLTLGVTFSLCTAF